MNARAPLLGLASAVTTFLLVGAVSIEILGGQYGESPGVGILGVFAGLVAALLAAVVVTATADRIRGMPAALLAGYGAVGVTFLVIAGLQYVNVPGADDLFSVSVHLGASVLVGALVAAVAALGGRLPTRRALGRG